MGRSKLKVALAAEKGVDFKKLKEKKKHKQRVHQKEKRLGKRSAANESSDEEDEDEDEDDIEGGAPVADEADSDVESDDDEMAEDPGLAALDESDTSESEIEMEKKIERTPKGTKEVTSILKKKSVGKKQEDEEDEDEEEDEEDIPMSDLEDLPEDEKEDLVRHSRLTINNTAALLTSLNRISIPTDKSVPFSSHQTVVSSKRTGDEIEDVQDDLKRELAFYAQNLEAAKQARKLLKAEGVPFARPTDYFAEMIKDDGHMEKVKAKLVEEASAKKASAEARKLRDLKKFGKQVQVAKLQERQKTKRETLEKIKTLKRKRQETGGDVGEREADLFDVGVDDELKKYNKSGGGKNDRGAGGPNAKRQKKNEKYGFGGKKKHSKSGDAISSGDVSGFSARRMKTGAKAKPAKTARLGKSRRKTGGKR
ncbi:eukaryotic rRNA processing protein EBP2-domain-containing protein [Xylariomycetidae sp. FL0641]|nr:eukaryotic rRNA processing protein EBP2-domain-containing protein [Xylariomycetidae sp. FL0641]